MSTSSGMALKKPLIAARFLALTATVVEKEGIKMQGNPLYKKVSSIALAKKMHREVRQSAFNGIRNQSSVRAIMKSLGYKADCETNPQIWKIKPIPVKRSISIEKPRAVPVGTRRKIELMLKADGVFHFKDMGVSRDHAIKLGYRLRAEGWQIENINAKREGKAGRPRIIGFKLAQ